MGTEEEVLNLFNNDSALNRAQIKEKINKKDPSETIRNLLYFEYLIENEDKTLSRTNKEYTDAARKKECKPKDYEIVLNKVFTGSHLEFNLGHEIINFIKDNLGQRYVYLNPLGERGEEAANKTKYVFHIIDSSINDENGKIYELVAVSEIDRSDSGIYKKGSTDLRGCPIFEGHNFYDIFYCGSESDKAYYYTYKASKLFRPKDNLRIILRPDRKEATITRDEANNKITIDLMCNPQHSICYADASGKITYHSTPNANKDKSILKSLITNGDVIESNETIDINNIDDEQCFSIISGRAQLEVSTSNQIAYFLRRDSNLLYSFLHDFLGVDSVDRNEKFDIVREKEKNIDLLFKSDNHIIVVENKIDSKINGKAGTPNSNGKYNSQLSKYYDYVEREYAGIGTRKYFVLAPEYNDISQQQLNDIYENGDKYILKTYNELFRELNKSNYSPLGLNPSNEQTFLFSQFKKSIEYLTWSKGKQRERTAYIRLKQRIAELNVKNSK